MSQTSTRSPAPASPLQTPSARKSAASSVSQTANPAPANPRTPPCANRAPAPSPAPLRPARSAPPAALPPPASPPASSPQLTVPDAQEPPGPNPHPPAAKKTGCAGNFGLSQVAASSEPPYDVSNACPIASEMRLQRLVS